MTKEEREQKKQRTRSDEVKPQMRERKNAQSLTEDGMGAEAGAKRHWIKFANPCQKQMFMAIGQMPLQGGAHRNG